MVNPLRQELEARRKPTNPLRAVLSKIKDDKVKMDAMRAKEAQFNEENRVSAGADMPSEVLGIDMGDFGTGANKLGAGLVSGMMNVGQGVGNMLGMVDDKTIEDRKLLETSLSDTGMGSTGQFLGEMAALAPLGVVGKGAQVAHKAIKGSRALPAATRALTGTAATIEGGAAGAILANPNERKRGAALGASSGLLLNKAMAGLSRVGKDGLVKVSDKAKSLSSLLEKTTGRKPFIPLTQAADDTADGLSNLGKVSMFATSMLPSAKRKFYKQAYELENDAYESNIRRAFTGKGKEMGDKAVDRFRKDDDVLAGLEAGVASKKNKTFSTTQNILEDAASTPTGRYTPKQLLAASMRTAEKGKKTDAPLRRDAMLMEDVLPKPVTMSDVFTRDMYRETTNAVGKTAAGAPGLGSVLASRPLQNFLMGNTHWQRKLQEASKKADPYYIREVLSDIRRAMSAQPAVDDESSDFMNAQENVLHYKDQATGMMGG